MTAGFPTSGKVAKLRAMTPKRERHDAKCWKHNKASMRAKLGYRSGYSSARSSPQGGYCGRAKNAAKSHAVRVAEPAYVAPVAVAGAGITSPKRQRNQQRRTSNAQNRPNRVHFDAPMLNSRAKARCSHPPRTCLSFQVRMV